ncbi:MAG: hypothetical protein WCY01_12905 [Alkalispirochaeta sp.]
MIAEPAKALVDLLYLTPNSDDEGFLQELRREPPAGDSHQTFPENLRVTAEKSASAKTLRAVDHLIAISGWRKPE